MTAETTCPVKHRSEDISWGQFWYLEIPGRVKYGTQTRILEVAESNDRDRTGQYAIYKSNGGPSSWMQGLSITLI